MERTLALYPDVPIGKEELQLPNKEILQNTDSLPSISPAQGLPLQDFLDKLEKDSIIKALNQSRYNRTKAAKTLGITVRSLRYRMERLGLNERT